MHRRTTGTFFWRATSTGVSAIAVGGFVLSFSTLRDLAIRSGIPTELAFIWPLIVDGFILVATAAAWALRNQARGTWYPWAALVLFSGISVAGNALHASMVRTVDVNYWVATVVSAIPSVAQILASHLLVVMARARETQRQVSQETASEGTPVTTHVAPAEDARPAVDSAMRRPLEAVITAEQPAAARVPRTPTVAAETKQGASPVDDDLAQLAARVREARSGGEEVSGALVARLAGVSERTGRRRLTDLRSAFPDLFTEPEEVSA
ncbi:DUF2637 domain-containing protein [Streptomyces sp. L7]|uniref:DUF2637 domain-containing protein n=1 Tax=Streptomyces sp. L7 TaxID=3423954 RepID=UPI003D99ABE0